MERDTSFNDIDGDRQKSFVFYNGPTAIHGHENMSINGNPIARIPDNFSDYLRHLNLTDGLNVIVLSSTGHFYYEPDELKDVQVIINLKVLNQISELNDFLKSVYCIIPKQSLFIGCFSDSENQSWFYSDSGNTDRNNTGEFDPVENGIESRIPLLNRIYNFIDIKTNRYLTKKAVVFHMEDTDLEVLDMKDINGLTYFCARKSISAARKFS